MNKEYFLKVKNLLDFYTDELNRDGANSHTCIDNPYSHSSNIYEPNLRDIMTLLIHIGRVVEFLLDKEVK